MERRQEAELVEQRGSKVASNVSNAAHSGIDELEHAIHSRSERWIHCLTQYTELQLHCRKGLRGLVVKLERDAAPLLFVLPRHANRESLELARAGGEPRR